jgi:uncharacterized membrane protein
MPLVRFHAFQSIGIAVVAFVVDVGLDILGMAPFTYSLINLLRSVLYLLLFVVWIVAILKAYKGEWFKLPVIGDFALKQAQS